MRSRALLPGAAAAALIVAGCGSSASHVSTVKPKTVSASVIAHAASRAAAAPGYAFDLTGGLTGSKVGGTANVSGSGTTDAKQTAGTLNVKVTPPGSLAALGALQTKLIVSGGKAYIEIPQSLGQALPGGIHSQWLSAPLTGLASQAHVNVPGVTSTTPSDAFRSLATHSTGTAQDYGTAKVDGQTTTHYREQLKSGSTPVTVDVWIASGMPRQVELSYSATGLSGHLTLTFTSFAAQSAPTPPANAGSLSAAINQALKTGL